MSKTRGSKLPWDARAAEALSGKARLDAAALIGLVNEVNPTGRGRDAKESAARYALKARLESLLVTRFPESVEVVREAEQEGLVSLRHRTQRGLACHAILDALDDDARSWVRLQLDLGAAAPDSDPRPARPAAPRGTEDEPDSSDPEATLRAALHAEEEFDFEQAGQLYARAFRQGRDARSALALLRFLVDAIAADADALALDGELPAAARAHPGVRVLLGVAAARSGDEARALGYVEHVEDPRAAEALALVARSALARDDTDAAALRLEEAAALDPSRPELRPLAEELARRREAQRAPHEAELGRLVSEGRDVEATARAEAILARWPSSEAARRAARTLEARRKAEEGRALLAEADAARGRGESLTALALVHRALAAPLDDDTRGRARRAALELEAEEREREAARQVEQVAAALREQEKARGLAAYVELDEALQARVRARTSLAALEWIDAMLRAGCRPRAAVDAALALERAAALPGADPAAVLGWLAPHERALESVPHARRLADQAREAAAEERRRHAVEALGAAEDALAAGDAERSLKLLERAARDLGPADASAGADRARADALRARLGALAERQHLEKRFERARASQHYAGARRCAEALAASAEGPERARWQEVARTYVDDLRRRQRLRVFELDGGADCSRGVYLSDYPPAVIACVDLRAGVVVLPTIAGTQVFVQSFAIETGRMVRCVRLVAPERLDEPRLELAGESVLISGGSNGVLELSLATGEPLRWSMFRDARNMERRFSLALSPVAGGRYLWVMHDGDGSEGHVYDLDGERPPREIPGVGYLHALPGVIPPRVAAVRNRDVLTLHEAGGIQSARFDFPASVWAVAPHPSGDGLVVVFERAQRVQGQDTLTWAELSPHGEHRSEELIPGATGYPRVAMACARDAGMVFLRFMDTDEQLVLVALAREPGAPGTNRLRVAYRVPLGPRRILAQDPEGRRVYVVGRHDEGVEVIPLGPEPPVLPERAPAHVVKFPLSGLWACMQPGGAREKRARGFFLQRFKWKPIDSIRLVAQAQAAQLEGDLPGLVDLFWGQALSDDAVGAGELGARLLALYPDDPEVRQVSWGALAVQRRWEALIALLGPVDPASLPTDGERKHRHHLLAAACFAVGDVGRAALHLEEGKALPGKCDLQPLIELGAALSGELPIDDVPGDLPSLRQLLALLRAADARLERGDHAGVIALFERSLTWEIDEVQSFGRLAEAHLARPAGTEQERLVKSLALAHFSDLLYENRVSFRREVLVPGATWTEERLDALAARADAWLAEDGAR